MLDKFKPITGAGQVKSIHPRFTSVRWPEDIFRRTWVTIPGALQHAENPQDGKSIHGALAISLTLVSITWGYRHIAPLLQFLFTAGAGLGLILASVSVRYNLILATYAVIAALILAFAHVLIAFSVFSF